MCNEYWHKLPNKIQFVWNCSLRASARALHIICAHAHRTQKSIEFHNVIKDLLGRCIFNLCLFTLQFTMCRMNTNVIFYSVIFFIYLETVFNLLFIFLQIKSEQKIVWRLKTEEREREKTSRQPSKIHNNNKDFIENRMNNV